MAVHPGNRPNCDIGANTLLVSKNDNSAILYSAQCCSAQENTTQRNEHKENTTYLYCDCKMFQYFIHTIK